MESVTLIVGLGNPGSKYENTRHNMGFEAINELAQKYNISVSKLKHKALIGDKKIGDKKIILAKPQTYMNLSGESVAELLLWFKVNLENLIVIYDDIDFDIGQIRIKPRGSAGTHNGMKSIISIIKNEDFKRIRIGIGKPPIEWDLANYVLSKFTPEEKKIVNESIIISAKAVTTIIENGIEQAMNIYNSIGMIK